jgi:hypothetical protein
MPKPARDNWEVGALSNLGLNLQIKRLHTSFALVTLLCGCSLPYTVNLVSALPNTAVFTPVQDKFVVH